MGTLHEVEQEEWPKAEDLYCFHCTNCMLVGCV